MRGHGVMWRALASPQHAYILCRTISPGHAAVRHESAIRRSAVCQHLPPLICVHPAGIVPSAISICRRSLGNRHALDAVRHAVTRRWLGDPLGLLGALCLLLRLHRRAPSRCDRRHRGGGGGLLLLERGLLLGGRHLVGRLLLRLRVLAAHRLLFSRRLRRRRLFPRLCGGLPLGYGILLAGVFGADLPHLVSSLLLLLERRLLLRALSLRRRRRLRLRRLACLRALLVALRLVLRPFLRRAVARRRGGGRLRGLRLRLLLGEPLLLRVLIHHCRQLLGQLVAVLLELAVEDVHLAALDHPDLPAHGVDERHVVRDDHHPALEVAQRRDKAVHCLQVEVVGRLVEQQKVRALHPQLDEDDARLLPAREGGDLLLVVVPLQPKAAEHVANLLVVVVVELVHQVGDGRELLPLGEAHVLRQLVARVLVVHADATHPGLAHFALCWV
mmetsp:Transcript_26579/g.60765  ORF Transcript_26579/g.60765 Transcript_26579/m.60765 type:complete len:444 (+) Transcript_26579:146-1477(+)